VDIGGNVLTLRYIGIDTPETVAPGSPVEWMGPEASAANAALVDGQTVFLEKDVSETDRFGRLLRYVYLASGVMVNEELVRLGYAYASSYPPDVRHQLRFQRAQNQAAAEGRGLWGATPPPTPTPAPAVPPPPAGNCDPSYPGVCIPPYPPDLDCGQISFRRFQVVPPDPHGFDGDHDGIGCES
jgi:micrococcal nuclease